MASLAHVYVGLVAARLAAPAGAKLPPRETCIVFGALGLLPDADVVGMALGVPYASPFGHRGFTHSVVFALGASLVAWAITRSWRRALLVLLAVGSHGPLDTLTDGGLGAALLWPFSPHRFFAPWRPIPVAPLGRGFFSTDGLACVFFETLWFAPLWLWALWPRAARPEVTSSSGTSP